MTTLGAIFWAMTLEISVVKTVTVKQCSPQYAVLAPAYQQRSCRPIGQGLQIEAVRSCNCPSQANTALNFLPNR
eukprot:3666054-Amphidinium_carterae.1